MQDQSRRDARTQQASEDRQYAKPELVISPLRDVVANSQRTRSDNFGFPAS